MLLNKHRDNNLKNKVLKSLVSITSVFTFATVALSMTLGATLDVVAAANPQDPSTESIISVYTDGVDLDAAGTTATVDDSGTPDDLSDDVQTAGQGTDDSSNNGVVKNFDSITYNIETSLNDADDTNVNTTVVLNDKATWTAIPASCLTVAAGFAVSPDSSITDTTGDGLMDTLVCNHGDLTEGTKVTFKANARATGNNHDGSTPENENIVYASALSNSDNNINTGDNGNDIITNGNLSAQGDGPTQTMITAGFGIHIDKSVAGLSADAKANYTPVYKANGALFPGSKLGKIIDWHIALKYDTGSEVIADNGSGTQDFTITDTWTGVHSLSPIAVDSDNANGDYDDQGQLYGTLTGNPADSCSFVDPMPSTATVTCTQNNPGEPITIQINGAPVTNTTLANVSLKTFFSYDPIFVDTDLDGANDFSGTESYFINNTAELTGWGGTGTMVTSASGVTDPGPEVDSDDWNMIVTFPSAPSYVKTFDGIGASSKSGQRTAIVGEKVETTLLLSDPRLYNTEIGVCDTIDVNSFTFAGSLPTGQIAASDHGVVGATVNRWQWGSGVATPVNSMFNPLVHTSRNGSGFENDARKLDGLLHGVTVEYSAVPYSATGDTHWTATCEDSAILNDWTTDYTTLPAGDGTDVVRVRMMWDRDWDSILSASHPTAIFGSAIYSFDLEVNNVLSGSYLPNTAAFYNNSWSTDSGISDSGGTSNGPILSSDSSFDPAFSFTPRSADRVYVLGSSMSIEKGTLDTVVAPSDTVTWSIDPSTTGELTDPVTMTFIDTLPPGLTYSSDTCAAVYAAATPSLTCTSSVVGQVVTFTVVGYNVGDDLPAFDILSTVDATATSGVYTNNVSITSDSTDLTQDFDGDGNPDFCSTATNTGGAVTAASVANCIAMFNFTHTDQASVKIVAQDGAQVSKQIDKIIEDPHSDYTTTLTYAAIGSTDPIDAQIIDILPHNGDGTFNDSGNYGTIRYDANSPATDKGTFSSTELHTTSAPSSPFVSVTGTNGEVFEYTTDDYFTLDHRPCHPKNWPAGDVLGGGNALLDNMCSEGLVDPATDIPTMTQVGLGTTTWIAVDPNTLSDADKLTVTAVRATVADVQPATSHTIELVLNTLDSHEDDIFCNNFGSNLDIVTLDIISNDVCITVVDGSIGNAVWFDDNMDGVQDTAELPISGVDIKLLVEDTDPASATFGTFIPYMVYDSATMTSAPYVVTTDANGNYLFENLPAANFQVMIDDTTLPAGLIQTYDLDDQVTTTPGSIYMTDITLAPVYTDVDGDGEYDPAIDTLLDIEAKSNNETDPTDAAITTND